MVVTHIIPNLNELLDKIFAYLTAKGYDLSRMKGRDIIYLMDEYRKMPDYPTSRDCSGIRTTGVVVGTFEDCFFIAREDGRIIKVPIEDCYVESY